MGLFLFVTSWRQIFIFMNEEKPKKKRKKKDAEGSKERKPNWKEYTATVEDIKTFLSDHVYLQPK